MNHVTPRTSKNQVVKYWVNPCEATGLISQVSNVAQFPDLSGPVAIMADAHIGKGVPIGTVFGTHNTVIPNAVGNDIGCGMTMIPLVLTEDKIREKAQVIKELARACQIFSVRKSSQYADDSVRHYVEKMPRSSLISGDILHNLVLQNGTLGGGNHFIEFQKDSTGQMYLMVHSGSRNLGSKINTHYNNIAMEQNKKNFSSVPAFHNLAFLSVDSDEGQEYLQDMEVAIAVATANRHVIIQKILDGIFQHVEHHSYKWSDSINCVHNFARQENHFGKNVFIHRKGATYAGAGHIGLIPGSMGSNSYVIEGKGNKDSYNSCSHGAGRVHSRSKAKELLDLEVEQALLDDIGVVHDLHCVGQLDEATSAYKDIDEVMSNQADLVKIVTKLTPVLTMKN